MKWAIKKKKNVANVTNLKLNFNRFNSTVVYNDDFDNSNRLNPPPPPQFSGK
jgi:hypothetical protein